MKKCLLLCLIFIVVTHCTQPDRPENYGRVETELYIGDSPGQPLIVGLGGSEGGNAWTSSRWKATRDKFLEKGYAFLAIGYFGGNGTPAQLDRISIDAIHDAILEAVKNPSIDKDRIALIGGSKGSELALLMASHYPDIKCVVGIVPSHIVFPALTISATTSSWMYHDKEVPFAPMPWSAVPSLIKRDLRRAFEIIREDKEAVKPAMIAIENINGPVLFLSATKDEMWPSKEMGDEAMIILREKNFGHVYEHVAIEGGHTAPLEHFDIIFDFLERNFFKK